MSLDAMKLALEALEFLALETFVDLDKPFNVGPTRGREAITALRAAIEQPRQWQGLSPFDKTLLRTTYAPMKPLYYDKENDHSVCAEVVTDWDSFFAAIESKLQERNP